VDCRITIQQGSDVMVVSAAGELDAFVLPKLCKTFAQVVAAGPERLVLDLERVTFMDSSALGTLVRNIRAFRERRNGLRVVLPGGPARRIFEITTLDRVLPTAPSRAAALAELGAGNGG
jgi:anti-sigma B factor antagonist